LKAVAMGLGAAAGAFFVSPAWAADPHGDIYSTNDFGGIGLINMRTARFAPDGQYEIGASFVEPYRRYYMTWQILPRMEITFRYTDVTNVINGGTAFPQSQGEFFKDILGLTGGSTYLDRAFDFKFRIWDEGPIIPAFAVGLQDTIGTGLFTGEYAVFTKRIADFDVTAGMGWGYFATRNTISNPMRILSDRYDVRSSEIGHGGKLNIGDFFAGKRAGVFFGVEYFTPIKSLTLKMEYASLDMDREPLGNPQAQSLPVNVAVNWRPHDWFNVQVGLERGNAAMVKLSLRQNFQLPGLPHIMDPPPEPIKPRPGPERTRTDGEPLVTGNAGDGRTWLDYMRDDAQARRDRAARAQVTFAELMDQRTAAMTAALERQAEPAGLGYVGTGSIPAPEQPVAAADPIDDPMSASQASGGVTDEDREVAQRLFRRLGAAGYPVEAVELDELSATVYYLDRRFRPYSKNLGRISRIMANELPPGIEVFTIVYVGKGLESSRVSILRKDLENAAVHRGSPEEIWANAVIQPPHLSQSLGEDAIRNTAYPNFSWSLKPDFQQHVGDPDLGLWAADLRVAANARLKLRRNLWITGQVSKFVVGNLDHIRRSSNSVLPHVRSDIREYLQQGRNSLDQLQLDYLFRPARNVWGRLSAGIFEMMYGGVSGELAYEVPNSPWHLGIDLNWVKKRDFNQRFGFQDYDVVTGHLRIAYDLPFYDLTAGVRIGRYLAGDRGATFEIARRFESGIRVGGFFTLTNVSAEDFGEGSFDKGFYITIPLDMFMLRSSTRIMGFGFRPLTRDGGQFVSVGPSPGGIANGDDYRSIVESWSQFMD
jgi:hypothetical protein